MKADERQRIEEELRRTRLALAVAKSGLRTLTVPVVADQSIRDFVDGLLARIEEAERGT